MREVALAVEILHQPPFPGRREIERGDQRREQPDVAHADVRRRQAVMRGRLETEREHLGVGGGGVGAAEGLDAGLQEFGRAVAAVAEHRAEIAEALRAARPRARRDSRANRDGEIRPQAKSVPAGIGGEEHAARGYPRPTGRGTAPRAAASPASRARSRHARRRDQRFRARVQRRTCRLSPAHEPCSWRRAAAFVLFDPGLSTGR